MDTAIKWRVREAWAASIPAIGNGKSAFANQSTRSYNARLFPCAVLAPIITNARNGEFSAKWIPGIPESADRRGDYDRLVKSAFIRK
jgi:hypothetical protein